MEKANSKDKLSSILGKQKLSYQTQVMALLMSMHYLIGKCYEKIGF